MITIFSTAKPFIGHIGRIQKRAVKSWINLDVVLKGNAHQIILLGNEKGTAKFCKEHDLLHIPDVSVNEHETPYVNDIFRKAQQAAKYDVMAYVNADIILTNSFMIGALKSTKFEHFLTIGQRRDWNCHGELPNVKNLELHSPVGIDYFVFKRGDWLDLPPLLIGRVMWDNYFVFLALEREHTVIDGTDFIEVIHQQHIHKKVDGVSVKSGPERLWNKSIVKGRKCFVTDTTWKIQRNGDVQRVD